MIGALVQASRITVFGAGYVGLVSGVCLAASGHLVTVLDVDESKLESLRAGIVPFHEPELPEVMQRALAAKTLSFAHADAPGAYGEFIFIAVGTPSTLGGSADLRFVRTVVEQIAQNAPRDTVVIMKSTVPPGTGALLSEKLAANGMHYVSNPEFLREGRAVNDWFHTDRIVLGGDSGAVERVAGLYQNIEAPIVAGDISSAELIKYASNAFLATKISFANEIANLCDCVDADVELVMRGVGLDARIGSAFLAAGIGYGGSCFPKDTRALDFLSSINGHDFHLLKAVIDVNARQRLLPIMALHRRLGDLTGVSVAVLGLTFKPDTDDIRESPAIEIIGMLLAEGADVVAYDPVGAAVIDAADFEQAATIEDALRGAGAAIVTTEWEAIATADWAALTRSMASPRLVYDGRNCLDPAAVRAGGGEYLGVGRR